jgi:hypothetical protein
MARSHPVHKLNSISHRVPLSIDKKHSYVRRTSMLCVSTETAAVTCQSLSPATNEADSMLNDLESSLAQFLSHNTSNPTSRTRPSSITDDESNRKSLPIIRSVSNMTSRHDHVPNEPLMRVEWLDDAMQVERQKMIDEDEQCCGNSQSQGRTVQSKAGQKRPLVETNIEQCLNSKKKSRL